MVILQVVWDTSFFLHGKLSSPWHGTATILPWRGDSFPSESVIATRMKLASQRDTRSVGVGVKSFLFYMRGLRFTCRRSSEYTIARFFLEIRCKLESPESPRGYAHCLCGWTPCETLWQENLRLLFSPYALRATIDRHHLSTRCSLRSLSLMHPSLAGLSRRQGSCDAELPHVRIERRPEESFFQDYHFRPRGPVPKSSVG